MSLRTHTRRMSILFSILFTIIVSLSLVTGGATPSIDPPPQPNFNFYFGNLHSHSSFSDGSGTPAEAYRHARDRGGLHFLAITEHNHAAAGPDSGDRADGQLIATNNTLYPRLIQDANQINEDGRFVAIYGQEFSSISRGNHTNVFMANRVIRTENGRYDQVFTNQWISDHGVQAIQLNHAWEGKRRTNSRKFLSPSDLGTAEDTNYGISLFNSFNAWRQAIDGRATLIEVINGPALRNVDTEHGETAFGDVEPEFYFTYLNMGLHLAPTGDQDNHYRTWGTINENRTVVLAPELTRTAILRAMQERRVYASEDMDLKVLFTVNGNIMGSIRPRLQSGAAAAIRVGISDTDEPNSRYRVDLYYDSGPGGPPAQIIDTRTVSNNSNVTINHMPINRGGYYFVVVTGLLGANKDYMAWTAPVWFE
jgi:hypothetical protein